jgi:chorismate-pyruvate lyase
VFRHSLAALIAITAAACTTTTTSRSTRSGTLKQFEAVLAANASATTALGQWCGRQLFADPPLVTALPVVGAIRALSPAMRELLQPGPGEEPAVRIVRLSCGGRVLSEAENWYVPARLTPEMNARLATTQTPFGTVAAPLGFTRESLFAQRGRAAWCPEGTILSHRARLVLPGGKSLALVTECYTSANLDSARRRD